MDLSQQFIYSFRIQYKFDQQASIKMIVKQSYWNWDNLMAKEIMTSPPASPKKQIVKQLTDEDVSFNSPSKFKINKVHGQNEQLSVKISKVCKDSPTNENKYKKSSKALKSDIKIKIKNEWHQCTGICKNSSILFFSLQYDINKITKLKLYPDAADNCLNFYQMKIVYENQQVYFGLPLKIDNCTFPPHFSWFLRITIQKMKEKVNINQFYKKEMLSVASSMKQNLPTSSRYCGYVYKKSQYLGNWSKRWLIVRHDGLHSFNTENHQETFFIPAENIKYFWTRFQTINDYLIVKIKHGIRKTQFAVPLYQLLEAEYGFLHEIYQLMMMKTLTPN